MQSCLWRNADGTNVFFGIMHVQAGQLPSPECGAESVVRERPEPKCKLLYYFVLPSDEVNQYRANILCVRSLDL